MSQMAINNNTTKSQTGGGCRIENKYFYSSKQLPANAYTINYLKQQYNSKSNDENEPIKHKFTEQEIQQMNENYKRAAHLQKQVEDDSIFRTRKIQESLEFENNCIMEKSIANAACLSKNYKTKFINS